MKKLFMNWRIRYKMLTISVVAVFSIVLFGFVVNYFFDSLSAVSYILKAERAHHKHIMYGVGQYYAFLYTKNPDKFKIATQELDSAMEINSIFIDFVKLQESMSEEDFQKHIEDVFRPITGSDKSASKIISGRLEYFHKSGNHMFKSAIEIAGTALEQTQHIKKDMYNYIDTRDSIILVELDNNIHELFKTEEKFVRAINDVNKKIQSYMVYGIIITVLCLSLFAYLITYIISGIISKPLNKLKNNLALISKGDLAVVNDYVGKDEIGELSDSVRIMQKSFVEIMEHAKKVAQGDYSGVIIPKSEKDELSVAINKMTLTLQEAENENKKRNWLKNGQNELNNLIRGEQDLQVLTANILNFLCKYLPAQVGTFYLLDENISKLVLFNSFAFTRRKDFNYSFDPGEGMIGQASREKEIITISNVPENYTRIRSSVGEMPPVNLIFIPLWHNDVSLGVIELGSITELTNLQEEFIRMVLENIAISIHTAHARDKMRSLLHKTQEQAEELQVQQEELRQSNEELEEQTRALKASEEALQAQQEELRVTNEELEERTKVLEKQRDDIHKKNDELERARVEIQRKANDLEQASRYKSEFLANMSHELRTPLNSILVLSQLMTENKQHNLTEKQIEYAKTINGSGADLLNLINEILDLSKVEAGKTHLNHEQVWNNEMKEHLMQVFTPLADKKGLIFEVEIDKDSPDSVYTDRLRLQQILRNLCSNAIKFTEKGSVRVIISDASSLATHRKDFKGKSLIAYRVQDTGIGISENKFHLIFEAFQQADGNTNRKYGGMGLGLTISRSFTELLGGEIVVESRQGQGSSFTLVLPVDAEQSKGSLEPQEQSAKKSTQSQQEIARVDPLENDPTFKPEEMPLAQGDGNSLILIVEDDEAFSLILQDIAQQKGYKTIIAESGETGLHYADYYKPDAILLDIGLPGINGWEVVERLQKNPATKYIPIHVVSGSQNEEQAKKSGIMGFLTKPVSMESINEALSEIEKSIAKTPGKILIVEDDLNMRKSIVELLSQINVKTQTADTGKEALNIIAKETFDCIIVDLGLHDMSGFNLIEKIRANDTAINLPIIIYTGKDLNRNEEEKLQKLANSIIIKGAKSPERLLSEVKLFLHSVSSKLGKSEKAFSTEPEDVLKNKKILLVDDDMRNVFALASVLEDRGMQVVVGKNGREGIEKLKQSEEIDLILMDIMMPEMDGYEAIRLIRKEKKFQKLPIIALTAKAMKDDRAKCIEAGANDYLAKPIDTEKLLSLLRVWLYK